MKGGVQPQHFAFLADGTGFGALYRRILSSGLAYWADPQMTLPGQFNTLHGGRGVYFFGPPQHGLEVITRPYGSAGPD